LIKASRRGEESNFDDELLSRINRGRHAEQ
jgi:hypothetical protein